MVEQYFLYYYVWVKVFDNKGVVYVFEGMIIIEDQEVVRNWFFYIINKFVK